MNNRQIEDSKKCDEMQEQGEEMDCTECSCSCCIAQEPINFKDGLLLAKEIVEKEMKFAIEVNPQMAMGMSQILMLVDKEIKNQ